MAKKDNRGNVALECSVCKNRNYTTTKNQATSEGKLELNKYCNVCRKHTKHVEKK